MAVDHSSVRVPTRIAGLLAIFVGVSFLYGIVVMGSIAAPIAFWLGIVSLGISLFVVYLLYRFVLAVETIAEKL